MTRLFLLHTLFLTPVLAHAMGEMSGSVSLEQLAFNQNASASQSEGYASVALKPEIYVDWDGGDQSFTFVPFYRYDEGDSQRTHFDIRELTWQKVSQKWELRIGFRQVFWGVTESAHMVDIINQTDLVENPDGEDKLGQPMINMAWIEDWGTLDFFLLTGFRERTFPGSQGRLRTPFPVDEDLATYQSGAEEKRVDWAVRYSRSLGPMDFGFSHFQGTSREPLLRPQQFGGETILSPFYPVIDQSGLDLQATLGGWLLKYESIYRQDFGDRDYLSLAGGFEYTFGNLGGRGTDVGVLTEYLYDQRSEQATTPLEDDIFIGTRIAFNDPQSTEILAGFAWDLDDEGNFISVEAERRIGNAWKLSLELRNFSNTQPRDPLYVFRNDDHLRLELARYF